MGSFRVGPRNWSEVPVIAFRGGRPPGRTLLTEKWGILTVSGVHSYGDPSLAIQHTRQPQLLSSKPDPDTRKDNMLGIQFRKRSGSPG